MEFKEVKEFIDLFIKNEYEFHYSEYNMEVSDEECEKIAQKVNNLTHSYFWNEYKRIGSIEEVRGDEKWENKYKRKVEIQFPRTLFQIKHYQNPKLGDTLKRIVISNDIWACYTSYFESSTGRELCYNQMFYVAETNEGFKIIDSIFYDITKHKWDNPAKESEIYQIGKVINAGTLLAVEKYNAPEDEICLKDYNKN